MLFSCISCTREEAEPYDENESSENDNPADDDPSDDPSDDPADDDPTAQKEYTVKIVTPAGLGVSGVQVYVHKSDAEFDVVGLPLTTNSKGEVKFTLPESDSYSIQLDKLSSRYIIEAGSGPHGRYVFDGTAALIEVDYNPNYKPGVYKVGDNIADFTITDVYGNTYTLSEILETKKMVMINLWFTGCGPCKSEFPAINTAYNMYSDVIEIFAISDYSTDSVAKLQEFPSKNGLTIDFPMCYNKTLLKPMHFGSNAYPTTIIIDRYGTICLIEVGSRPSVELWTVTFSYFTSDNYRQKLFNSFDEIPGLVKVKGLS